MSQQYVQLQDASAVLCVQEKTQIIVLKMEKEKL
jgi:hypothetical protein